MILELILDFIPIVFTLIVESALIKIVINVIKKIKETNELKNVLEQNKLLVAELREQKKMTRELLTKIDRIARQEE